jgi:hypothetical protein
MNYVRTILITTILLSISNLHNAETATEIQSAIQPIEASTPEEPKVAQATEQEQWDKHLQLLSENWDKTENIPTGDWLPQAIKLAKAVVEKDNSLVATVKSAFLDAINDQKTKLTSGIISLIKEFDDAIDAQIAPVETQKPQEEDKTTLQPVETVVVPEEKKVEPVVEAAPIQPVEANAASTSTEETNQSNNNTISVAQETTVVTKDLNSQWNELLDKIKTDESIGESLTKAYEIARDLLLSGHSQQKLEKTFQDALETRMLQKKIDPRVIKNEINNFRINVTYRDQPTYYPQPLGSSPQDAITQKQLEELRQEFTKKDVLAKEEAEKQKVNALTMRKALDEATKQGILSQQEAQTKINKLTEISKQREEAILQKQKDLQVTFEKEQAKMREAFTKEIKAQVAAVQKAPAEKGIISTITQSVSAWWYGSSPKKPTGLTQEEQKALLKAIVQNTKNPLKAKEDFEQFQQLLINFSQAWDQARKMPNSLWIDQMGLVVKNIVIEHEIMSLDDISNIIQQALESSGKISSPQKLIKIIELVKGPTNDYKRLILEEKQREENAKQQRIQRKEEKQQQILLAQQKIKDEKDRIEREEQHLANSIAAYKNEKKQWHELLAQVSANKQASHHDNHTHTQEALKKSQSLLQLADIVPNKKKAALSQKLKQKFSVALLEQQKNNEKNTNIYHNMDIFNKEINKMVE